jgi:hypothetical protein
MAFEALGVCLKKMASKWDMDGVQLKSNAGGLGEIVKMKQVAHATVTILEPQHKGTF